MNTIHLEPNDVPAILKGAYNGKKFQLVVCETVSIPADAGLWSGGSRNSYSAIDLNTGEVSPLSFSHTSPWNAERHNADVALSPGKAVIEHSMFQGKDMGLRFYIHPDNATKFLPVKTELTVFERLVLLATRCFKSSYGGQDRYQMARDDYNCEQILNGEAYPTREQWNAAKNTLIASGHLNKAGAITVKGRNAT